MRLLILTAARRKEVAGIREAEIAEGVWTLPARSTEQRAKTERGRKVAVADALPLPTQALEIIAELPRSPSGLLLTTTGTTAISGFSKMKRVLDALLTAQGKTLAPWTLHDLRRSAATGIGDLEVEPHIVSLILGHRIPGITSKVYNKSGYLRQKQEALQMWADRVEIAVLLGWKLTSLRKGPPTCKATWRERRPTHWRKSARP